MKSPQDDPRLTQFLRQHKPTAPNPAADLEHRLMSRLATVDQPAQPKRVGWLSRYAPRSRWVTFSTVAAAGLVAVVGYHALKPPALSDAELADLQLFIESTWHGSVSSQPVDASTTDDLFTPEDSKLN
jgi:hypothetical protein